MRRLLVIELIILVMALMPDSVLSHGGQSSSVLIANNSLEFQTSSTAEMATLISATGKVWHMEPDLYTPGNIIFSHYYALSTTNGITTTAIAGYPTSSGNTVAVGQFARFGSLYGFRQISPTRVVVVDYFGHCLRIVERITLQTPWYAGYCGSYGYTQGTTSARFKNPRGIILDKKRAGMLLLADYGNDAIRHVQVTVGSGLSAVSEFYKSSTLNYPLGLTQDPASGDLYITSPYKVFKLIYTSRTLILLAGSSVGFADGDFADSRFSHACEIVLIENGRKIVLSDHNNHRLRILDLITSRTSSFCTGQFGYNDGDVSSCALRIPYSLMVLNNTLYVGEYHRIRKLQGDICHPREYEASPDTGVALVEIPTSSGETVKVSLPPGSHQIYIESPTTNCTATYHITDPTIYACPNPVIEETVASDTGVAVVEVPMFGSQTELSLSPGSYPLIITSDKLNCSVEYNISDHRGTHVPISPCANSEVRQSASADTGVALVDMSWSGLNGNLTFPPGNYKLGLMWEGETCAVNIGVADHRLRRRLVFQAQYDVECETTEGNIAESPLTLLVARHTLAYSELCAADCTRSADVEIDITCTNHTLVVVWPSNLTYTGDVNRIPAELDQRLTSRIVAKGYAFNLFLPEVNPPIVFPEQQEHGGYMLAKFSSYCAGENIDYVKLTDSCEQDTEPDIPEM